MSLLLVLSLLAPGPTPTFNQLVDQAVADRTLECIPEPSKLFRVLGWGVHITQWGDLASTEYALSNGSVELNPLMKNRWVRVGASAAGPTVFNYATNKLHADHPKWAMVARIAFLVSKGWVIHHNWQVAS